MMLFNDTKVDVVLMSYYITLYSVSSAEPQLRQVKYPPTH